MRNETTNVKYPCHECTYFHVCGDEMRAQPCAGRVVKDSGDSIDVRRNSQRPTPR